MPVIAFTILRISGTSIGIYHSALYGNNQDSNLLLNHPQDIRSDEWLVASQLAIAQKNAGFPKFNPNIDSGRDMSLVGDAPYKDWSMLFKPQNLPFFILPFENAFALKWWLLLYLVIFSCYFFTLRILPNRRLFAALFSIGVGLSPFLFWWYQTSTLASIFYGFFILILAMRIINSEKLSVIKNIRLRYSYVIYTLLLAYLLTCFALILYPPFQIPIAICASLFIVGLLIDARKSKLLSLDLLKRLSVFVIATVLSILVIILFIHTRESAVNAISNTVYPGKRTVKVEGSPSYEILSTFLQPQLQRSSRAAHYFLNQSEASNFILILPFLIIPSLIVFFIEYKKSRKIDWLQLSVLVCIAIFLAYLFVPQLNPVFRLIALDKVSNLRLFIGFGFIGVIQLLLLLKSLENIKVATKRLNTLACIYSIMCMVTLYLVGTYAKSKYPEFINNTSFIVLLALFFTLILYCFISRKLILAAALLLLFSAGCVFRIHPLYRGLGEAYNGSVIQAIDKVSKPKDSWVVLDDFYYENFAVMANRNSLSGVKPYPSLSYWQQIDGSKDEYIYNRYAHVIFNTDLKNPFILSSPDSFHVQFSCNNFIMAHAKFALTEHKIDLSCLKQVAEVKYPARTFYIYKITK